MKIIVAPGVFKHSLRANIAADAIARGLARSGLAADTVLAPIADGGNGTLDVVLAAAPDGERHTVTVRGPLGAPVSANYGLIDGGRTAVIEMALASGLELIAPSDHNPFKASTYGTGQLMAHALKHGAQRFIVGLGGSATVDAGAGCLAALGARYFDANQRPVLQQGGGPLAKIARVDLSPLDDRWREVEVLLAVDVDNPPLGENGAAAVFGPQKGASPDDVPRLDAAIAQFITALEAASGASLHDLRGGGAAGALAAGLAGGVGAKVVSGIDLILEHTRFDAHLQGAALVVTGEGRMDAQTIGGKGPLGVALRAREAGVPSVALVGGLGIDDALLREAGLAAVLPIIDGPLPLDIALRDAENLLERAAFRLGSLLQLGMELG